VVTRHRGRQAAAIDRNDIDQPVRALEGQSSERGAVQEQQRLGVEPTVAQWLRAGQRRELAPGVSPSATCSCLIRGLWMHQSEPRRSAAFGR
jgi:hypothetical protein